MRTLTEQLSQYAAYHRDQRNIVTHFVGIPLIVQAIAMLLARPSVEWMGVPWSVALLVVVVTAVYYLLLDLRFGLVMAVLLGLALQVGQVAAAWSTSLWLTTGVGLFVVGWAFQFVGHYFEGKKPAFVDDLMGLIIGPLFVVAELAFALGMRRELQHTIEEQVGPVRSGHAA